MAITSLWTEHQQIGQNLRVSTLAYLFLALPLLEIAGFVVVGKQIGALATVGLVVASTIAGAMLLRHQGFGVMRRARAEMDAGNDPSRQLAHGAMSVLAAILFVVPGFITDIIALLLLLPPIRDLAWSRLKNRIVVAGNFDVGGFGGGFRGNSRDNTIDLDDQDYSRASDKQNPESPWRRLEDK